jgi:hypothetical protein
VTCARGGETCGGGAICYVPYVGDGGGHATNVL